MTTLKHLMEAHALEYTASDLNFTIDIAIHCVREWLEQKRQEVENRKNNLGNETNEVKIVVWNNLNNILNYIDRELLGELKQ